MTPPEKQATLEIGPPNYYGMKQVLLEGLGAMGLTALVLLLLILVCEVLRQIGSPIIASANPSLRLTLAICFWAGWGVLALAIFLLLIPVWLGSTYVARLVKKHHSACGAPGHFIAQITLTPRLYRGLRGFLEDADDVGCLAVGTEALVFTGGQVRAELPYTAITKVENLNAGYRPIWTTRKIRIHCQGLPDRPFVDFHDRGTATLSAHYRQTCVLLAAIEQKRGAGVSR